tara:strand:+ start:7307 stop:9646 length:2340 start_codon:yes stop_codon:yes gene_type:complete
MAKKQITIDDGSKGRKQVELNLNTHNLNPTIGSEGGNWRVAVQQTPKTTAAQQLAENLKQGVKVYGQGVKLAQAKAEDDVAKMTDEEYDKFLTEGLDPDAKSLFGYTKTYNQMLAQKYYAEEVPNKLQDISTEMFSNYYDYKDAATFEAALQEKTQGVYDEADALLNDNVFGNEANRVLKNVTQNDFVTKERAKFIQELPKRNAELGKQAINRGIDDIDDSVLAQGLFGKNTRDIYSTNAGSFRTPQEANEAFYTSTYTRIQTLASSKSTADNDLAQQMLDSIGNGKSITGIDRTIGGMDIFATGKRQLELTQLDAALEEKAETAYTDAVKAVQIPLARLESEAVRALVSDAPESEVRATLTKALADLETPEGITENPNDTQRDLIAVGIKSILDNPKLFKNEHAKNFYLNNNSILNTLYDSALNNLDDSLTKPVSSAYGARREPIGRGAEFVVDAKLKLAEMYTSISIESLKLEGSTERLLKFQELEQGLKTEFNSWKDEYLGQASIIKGQAEAVEQEEKLAQALAFDPSAGDFADNSQALDAIIKDGIADKKGPIDSDNNVNGFFEKNRLNNFISAFNGKFLSGEDLTRNVNKIHEEFEDGRRDADLFSSTAINELERTLKKQDLASKYTVTGISSTALLQGYVPSSFNKKDPSQQSLLEDLMYGVHNLGDKLFNDGNRQVSDYGPSQSPFVVNTSYKSLLEDTGLTFSSFPIMEGGDIRQTISAVETYFNAKEISDLDDFYQTSFPAISEQYKIPLDKLMEMQRSYLQKHNYIETK